MLQKKAVELQVERGMSIHHGCTRGQMTSNTLHNHIEDRETTHRGVEFPEI